ncbi:unnamed protein product [Amoebophrya sp. A25]|nr:unnamed protein product [Amoebophrya sp. A25]|eukprot:GSA25T00000379001.1
MDNFSADTFANKKTALKKVAPAKEKKGADDDGLESMRGLWKQCNGDLREIAKRTCSDERLLKKNPPKDEEDFAHKMLAGAYAPNDGVHG